MTQCNKILKAMLDNPQHKVWYAKDFQNGKNFVGYEATARMSDILRLYPEILTVGKDGRFRVLAINWKKKRQIKQIRELLDI